MIKAQFQAHQNIVVYEPTATFYEGILSEEALIMNNNLQVDTEVQDGAATLNLRGVFSFYGLPRFESACKQVLNNLNVDHIDLNFTEVTYIDSSALGMLLVLRQQAQLHNASLHLFNPNDAVARILARASFNRLFTIH
ncbi:MAG: STAS domain-containing protein [Gallionellaceae bacterium]